MMTPNADTDDAALKACIADIYAAFKGISRAEGISWSQCRAIDRYETKEEIVNARQADKDTCWQDLVDDPNWQPFPGLGGFSFIDTTGFRYYLPPTMIRFLRGDNSEWFPGHLLRDIDRHAVDGDSGWTVAQMRAIARFIMFMAAHDPEEDGRAAWETALERKWAAFLPAFENPYK